MQFLYSFDDFNSSSAGIRSPLPKYSSEEDNFLFGLQRKGDSGVMANVHTKKGDIRTLTGGGDVPGLHPHIRRDTPRALREGYRVSGTPRGWGGRVDMLISEERRGG